MEVVKGALGQADSVVRFLEEDKTKQVVEALEQSGEMPHVAHDWGSGCGLGWAKPRCLPWC